MPEFSEITCTCQTKISKVLTSQTGRITGHAGSQYIERGRGAFGITVILKREIEPGKTSLTM